MSKHRDYVIQKRKKEAKQKKRIGAVLGFFMERCLQVHMERVKKNLYHINITKALRLKMAILYGVSQRNT